MKSTIFAAIFFMATCAFVANAQETPKSKASTSDKKKTEVKHSGEKQHKAHAMNSNADSKSKKTK
jgi:hypothetical protein